MEVLIVNGKRYLINVDVSDQAQDEAVERILKDYPADAEVDWDEVLREEDYMPMTLNQIINNINK